MSECKKCGSPLQEGQDWCLQCGSGRPHSLGGGPGWRTGVAILGATALLVGGASVAAYAALNKTKPKAAVAVVAVKGTTTPVTPTTIPSTPGATTPTTTPLPGTPSTVKGAPPIPTQTPTPQSSGGADTEANNALFPPETKETKTTKTTSAPTKTSSEPTKSSGEKETNEGAEGGSETKSGSGSEPPSPILLDTDAASTYNPYNYPATLFGEASLAIDNEAKTAWTAQVQAEHAPKLAEGVVLDLQSPQKLGSVAVKTTTTGITVEVYASNSATLPGSISDPAWSRIVGLKVLKKKNTTLALKAKGKAYRFVLLWLAKAPSTSTAANPGVVSINEFELFSPK